MYTMKRLYSLGEMAKRKLATVLPQVLVLFLVQNHPQLLLVHQQDNSRDSSCKTSTCIHHENCFKIFACAATEHATAHIPRHNI